MSPRFAAGVAAVVACLLLPAVASATVTTSTVASPASGLVALTYDTQNNAWPVSVSGTSDGTSGDLVDIDCVGEDETGAMTFDTVKTNVAVAADGSFSITDGNGARYVYVPCRLLAVPAGTSPTDISTFHGPLMRAHGESPSIETAGPSTGKPYDYYDLFSGTRGYVDFDSLGGCGIDDGQPFAPTPDAANGLFGVAPYVWYCNGWYPRNIVTSPGTYRAAVRIDGRDGFFSADGHALQGDGWGGDTQTVTYDPVTDSYTIVENDSLTECPANVTDTQTTNSNCSSLSATGVSVKRTMVTDHNGLVTSQIDVWSSSGAARSIDLLDEQDFRTNSNKNGYRFPGEASLTAHNTASQVAIPASANPASMLYTYDTTASDSLGNPRGSISMWPLPDNATFTTTGDDYFFFHYAFTIPAGGSYTVSKIYSMETTMAALAPLTAAAEDKLAPPTVAITAPAEGATVSTPTVAVTGTAADNGGVPSLKVNGQTVAVASGAFSTPVALAIGANTITAVATDAAGNTATATRHLTFTPPPPALPAITKTGAAKLVGTTIDTGETVGCPAGGAACTVTVTVTTTKAFASAKKKKRVVASKTVTVKAGATLHVKLKLSAKGVKLLRKQRKLKVIAAISARAGTGTPVTAKRTFTIKAPKKKKGH